MGKGGERAYEGLQHLRRQHLSLWGPEQKQALPADKLVSASEVTPIRDVAAQWGSDSLFIQVAEKSGGAHQQVIEVQGWFKESFPLTGALDMPLGTRTTLQNL
jgi:hypothetical protein